MPVIAIIPAAGKGTRMASVTRGLPKELLPLGSKPVLARIIEECRDAGVDGIVVVNSHDKPQIDEAISEWRRTRFADLPLHIAYQQEAKGLAYAVAEAGVEDDALVLVGDVVYRDGSPSERMANLIYRGIDGCVAVEAIDETRMHLYGIVELDAANGTIIRILEKPQPQETASRWAVASRWGFSKQAMVLLADQCRHPQLLPGGTELHLTDFINTAIAEGVEFKAVALQPGQGRVDCGGPAGYEAAQRLPWD